MRALISLTGVLCITIGVGAVEASTGAATPPRAVAPAAATEQIAPDQQEPVQREPVVRVRPAQVTRPATARRAQPKPVVKHVAATPTKARRTTTHKATPHYPSGPTSWGALNAAIARIPTYRAGQAHWVVQDTGWWGTADWNTGVIYISHSVPESKLYDVAVHEWSHILTTRDYGNNPTLAIAATTAYFGGAGLNGAEYAADCMAILQGADWTNYTSCKSAHWRAGAQALIDGHRLPGIVV